MAARKQSIVFESTGAVEFDSSPVTATQTIDAASTNAAEYVSPGTTKIDHYAAEVTVRSVTPGPVTIIPSWMTGVQVKVVTPPSPKKPKSAKAEIK